MTLRRLTSILLLAITAGQGVVFAQTDTRSLVAEADPTIQSQIANIYTPLMTGERESQCGSLVELQRLLDKSEDKAKFVKQMAIYAAIGPGSEGSHVLLSAFDLSRLELSSSVTIRVLAPYVDSDDENVQEFAEILLNSYGGAQGRPPLGSVNYHEYMEYIRAQFARREEIPAGFIKYIYERNPGKALLAFAYADGVDNTIAQIQGIREAMEARQEGREPTADELRQREESKRLNQLRGHRTMQQRREVIWAEHAVSNAIWLRENKFPDPDDRASYAANTQLKLLSEMDWWARLYVVYIMRRHPELRRDGVLKELAEDQHELVREMAQATLLKKPS
jgi:hypothetical protein